MSIASKVVGLLGAVFGITRVSGTDTYIRPSSGVGIRVITSGSNSALATDASTFLVGSNTTTLLLASGPLVEVSASVVRMGNGLVFGWSSAAAGNGAATDTGMTRAAAGVARMHDGTTAMWLQNSAGRVIKAADQTVTDSATLVNDTHLTLNLLASRKYSFHGRLFCTSVATSGLKIDFDNSSASVTNLIISTKFFTAAAVAVVQSSTLAGDMGSTTAVVEAEISGTFEVNAAGTFGLRFAQNAETGAAESIVLKRGSYMMLEDMP